MAAAAASSSSTGKVAKHQRFPMEFELQQLAQDYCDRQAVGSEYLQTVTEADLRQFEDTFSMPEVVFFTSVWSKPTNDCPAPKAVVHVSIEVRRDQASLETGWVQPETYTVTQFKVEFEKFYRPAEARIQDAWLDKVIKRKLKCRTIIDLGDDFLNTRLDDREFEPGLKLDNE